MLSVIGIGPGSQSMMTMEAIEALQAAEIVVGYKTYTHLVKAFTGDKQVIKTGMCKEIERCQAAIELAQAGHNVALISSGDAGIYGMAGLVLELVSKQKLDAITSPVFVASGQDDGNAPNQPEQVARWLGDRAHYHLFKTDVGAGEHCSLGAEQQVQMQVFEWLSGILRA